MKRGPEFYQARHFASQRNLNTEGCLRYVNFHRFIQKDSIQHTQFHLLGFLTKLEAHYSATCKDGLNENKTFCKKKKKVLLLFCNAA